MPHFADMVYQLGGLPVMAGIPFGVNAKYYFVDPANGSDSNNGLSLDKALATILAAEDKCVGNQHDTVFYIAGSSSTSLTAQLLWDKSYTHLIGICAPTRLTQRARIFQLSTLDESPLVNITASGCIFKNFYIHQGVNHVASLIDVQITGDRNYFENVHFAGGSHATNAIDGGCSIRLADAHQNTFVNCTIGNDTADAGTGMACMRMATLSSKNVFENCIFLLKLGHNNAVFVELESTQAAGSFTWFNGCTFIANATNRAKTMASAFVIPSAHILSSVILLDQCSAFNITDWEDNERDILYLTGGTATKGGYTGLYQVNQDT